MLIKSFTNTRILGFDKLTNSGRAPSLFSDYSLLKSGFAFNRLTFSSYIAAVRTLLGVMCADLRLKPVPRYSFSTDIAPAILPDFPLGKFCNTFNQSDRTPDVDPQSGRSLTN